MGWVLAPAPSQKGRGRGSAKPIETNGRRARAGFTLAEVLAALAFMAIVIPVAIEGVRIAGLAGQVGQRKSEAVRIAERMLNEWVVTESLQVNPNGVLQENGRTYRWFIHTDTWPEDAMQQVTVQVVFQVQGRDYDVQLSTLAETETL